MKKPEHKRAHGPTKTAGKSLSVAGMTPLVPAEESLMRFAHSRPGCPRVSLAGERRCEGSGEADRRSPHRSDSHRSEGHDRRPDRNPNARLPSRGDGVPPPRNDSEAAVCRSGRKPNPSKCQSFVLALFAVHRPRLKGNEAGPWTKGNRMR
jgi:hypothetical protein